MAHEWDRGVLNASSWHGLEEIGVMNTAEAMIAHAERTGAWPTAVRYDGGVTATEGLVIPGKSIIADYQGFPSRCLSLMTDRFRAATPDEWRGLVKAATAAGATPTGCFSLRRGTRVLATFQVGDNNGLRTNLMLADAFDGTMRLTAGTTSVRVVCANTLAAAFHSDGKGMAKLRHTASLGDKVEALGNSIAAAIVTGKKVRDLYHEAEETLLHKDDAMAIFEKLFPMPSGDDATKQAKTRAENKRKEAIQAAMLPINKVGDKGTLATLWNASTYLVDRQVDGTSRKARGKDSDRLDSMLFGTRAKRINEIHQVMIEVLRPDGSVESMAVNEAVAAGVDPSQIGSKLIEDILADTGS